jgi:hypothetical protein
MQKFREKRIGKKISKLNLGKLKVYLKRMRK